MHVCVPRQKKFPMNANSMQEVMRLLLPYLVVLSQASRYAPTHVKWS